MSDGENWPRRLLTAPDATLAGKTKTLTGAHAKAEVVRNVTRGSCFDNIS